MTSITVPVNPQNFLTYGDLDILPGLTVSSGDGTIFVRGGGLYVDGLTDLDQTTIQTNDGEFNVNGPNKVSINISGGATPNVEIDAEGPSHFITSNGDLTLSATNTGSTGNVSILSSGIGDDSILINALNTTSGQITILSDGGSTTNDAIRLVASDTTDGNILITGAGNYASANPAVTISATNATSGQIFITSAGDAPGSDSILLTSTGTTNGNILLRSDGAGDSLELFANNASGKLYLHTIGTGADSINFVTSGGVTTTATGRVIINSADTTNGVTIATGTAGVPVTIGTSTSLTTIVGDLDVTGTFTTINTQSVEIEDNLLLLNAGGGEAGLDSGILMKRYQTPNDTALGDVVAQPNPVQESGAFAANGTSTAVTLDAFASNTLDFYKGWWIKVTSGAGINQVRRIKSYNQTTKVATIYATADNVVGPPAFNDGLDFTTTVSTADTYELYSRPYSSLFYGETLDNIVFGTVANSPDPIGDVGVSTAVIQQYQEVTSGTHTIRPQVYNNAYTLGPGTTTVTVTIKNHGLAVGDLVRITNSSSLTPSITSGIYRVATVPTVDTFTFTADASITSDDASSSTTVTILKSSEILTNVISPYDTDTGGISISGITLTEDIEIPRTSTAFFTINIAATTGVYTVHVTNVSDSAGAYAIFSMAGNGTNFSVSRIASVAGSDSEQIDSTWIATEKPKIQHSPAASAGSPDPFVYRVRIYSG